MNNYRIEIRIFGLLLFALISTLILAYGLEAADVQGEVAGVKFTVVGPSAYFIVIILIFFTAGLFKFGLKDDQQRVLNYPTEKLTLEEIETMLDALDMSARKIQRRKQVLETARDALRNQLPQDDVMSAIGMHPVTRAGT